MVATPAATVASPPEQSTVTAVRPDITHHDDDGYGSRTGYAADVEVSCGHNYHLAAMPDRWPKVGDPHSCMTCHMDRWLAEHPSVPDEQLAAIRASLPKCPVCGGDIDTIAFVKRTRHKLYVEIDAYNGDVSALSEHHDTLEEKPDWTERSGGRHEISVCCANDHEWFESRLEYRHRHGEHQWTIKSAEGAA